MFYLVADIGFFFSAGNEFVGDEAWFAPDSRNLGLSP